MKKLKVDLEHCYGIKKLQTEFDFESNSDVFAIYMTNGVKYLIPSSILTWTIKRSLATLNYMECQ